MRLKYVETYYDSIENIGEVVSHANVLKVCLNYSLINALELISELYAFAEKSGLDTAIVQEALKHIYGHPSFHLYIDKIHDKKFDEVNFDMRGGNKDVNLFQQAFTWVAKYTESTLMSRPYTACHVVCLREYRRKIFYS